MAIDSATLDLIHTIREARFTVHVLCVHCRGARVQRWGMFSGRQRYRCNACRRTFSDLTGTAAAYLKKINRLPEYVGNMPAGRSVRDVGRRMRIDKDTALRWRHRLLYEAPMYDAVVRDGLQGIIEVFETQFYCIRRERPRWPHEERERPATIAVLRDRQCRTLQISASRRLRSHMFERLFELVGDRSTIACRTGPLGAAATAVRRRRMRGHAIDFRWVPRGRVGTWLWHIESVVAFTVRERRWLRRFRGVSLQWAPNYLTWFEMVDEATRTREFRHLLDWPLLPG